MILGRYFQIVSRLRMTLVSAALCLVAVNSAYGHGVPLFLDVSPEGQLIVTSGEELYGLRVIADNAQTFNAVSGRTTAPGFDLAAELQDSTIQMRVLQTLFFWDKNLGLGGATPASLLAQRLFGAFDQTSASQTAIADDVSIVWDNDAKLAGTHHVVRFEIPSSSPTGAYGLLVQFEDITPVPDSLQSFALGGASDPVLIVFNQGLSTAAGPNGAPSEYRLGVDAIAAAAAVPEPVSVAGFGIGAVLLGAGYWHSRRRK